MRIEARRIAADNMADRVAPGRQSAPFERAGDGGNMLAETAPREQNTDRQRLDSGPCFSRSDDRRCDAARDAIESAPPFFDNSNTPWLSPVT